jgi:hypothetical protein
MFDELPLPSQSLGKQNSLSPQSIAIPASGLATDSAQLPNGCQMDHRCQVNANNPPQFLLAAFSWSL